MPACPRVSGFFLDFSLSLDRKAHRNPGSNRCLAGDLVNEVISAVSAVPAAALG